MNKYNISVTPYALRQMEEIGLYISDSLSEPLVAARLLDTLEQAILSLEIMPERCPLTDIEPWKSYGFRRILVKNYLIYFWIDVTTVHITAVVYGGKDQMTELESMDAE